MTEEIARAVREAKKPLRRETAAWQRAAVGLFCLSVLINVALSGLYGLERQRAEEEAAALQIELRQAQAVRDHAVRELGELANQAALDKLARQEQAEAYEALGAYRYIGACTVTAYCPCAECCGRWADGVTASGVPAGPGIVAVDPDVIPLGSTVIVDGQRYLAADTGVTGNHADICVTDHRAAEAFGVQATEVWILPPEGGGAT